MKTLTGRRWWILAGLLALVVCVMAAYQRPYANRGQPKISGEVPRAAASTAGLGSPSYARSHGEKASAATSPAVRPSTEKRVQQVVLSKAELETHPKFWLLGYSAEDISWLERFGYPTLDEENALSQATDEQLKAMADAGSKNAEVHLGVRLAQQALRAGDHLALSRASWMIHRSVIDGGPYQAAKANEFFVGIAQNRRSLGDLSDEIGKVLASELLPIYDLSKGISSGYGDFAAVRLFNPQRDINSRFGVPPPQPLVFYDAMQIFSNMNIARSTRGLQPYEFTQRPRAPGIADILMFQPSNTVFVR